MKKNVLFGILVIFSLALASCSCGNNCKKDAASVDSTAVVADSSVKADSPAVVAPVAEPVKK